MYSAPRQTTVVDVFLLDKKDIIFRQNLNENQ